MNARGIRYFKVKGETLLRDRGTDRNRNGEELQRERKKFHLPRPKNSHLTSA
jgi:hypothetical protein